MPGQRPILTVTLNPALDVSATVDRVVPGPKLRLADPVTEPGGGGVNVARAVTRLGGQARALVVIAGPTGARVLDLLRAEGVEVLAHRLAGDTRQSLSVTDAAGAQYRFILPGPAFPDPPGPVAILAEILAAAPGDTLVVLSGSQPPGLPAHFAVDLAQALGPGRLVVDTSGPALDCLIATPNPTAVLRMDAAEAQAVAGRPLPTPADTADFCAGLVARGVAAMVIAARGAEGSVLAMAGGRWHARPPVVPVVSTTGAGDSFTAGFCRAMAAGEDAPAALLAGTAAAAAAVMTPGSELCRRADAERLRDACRIARL